MKNRGLFYSPNSLRKASAPAFVSIVIFIGVVAASGYAARWNRLKLDALTLENSATRWPQDRLVGRLEAEVITIHPSGFEPAEIRRPAGPLILAVHNRSGLERLALRLDLITGTRPLPVMNRVRDMEMRLERADWDGVVDLPPGNYTVTEANHPEWILRLTLTPR